MRCTYPTDSWNGGMACGRPTLFDSAFCDFHDPRSSDTAGIQEAVDTAASGLVSIVEVSSSADELQDAPSTDELERGYDGAQPIVHPAPCDDCGSKDWPDWTLLPHDVYNSICPGGSGYLCLTCFAKRVLGAVTQRERAEAAIAALERLKRKRILVSNGIVQEGSTLNNVIDAEIARQRRLMGERG